MNHVPHHPGADDAPPESATDPGSLLIRPEEAARRLGISRSKLYELIREEAVPSMTIGRCRRVPAAALARWIEERTS